jgi:hypothetical protein
MQTDSGDCQAPPPACRWEDCWTSQNTWAFFAMLIIDGLWVLWMIVYSYLVYHTDPNRTPPAGTSPSND